MDKTQWLKKLSDLRACREAVAWFETQEAMETAWTNCERADWMLWLIGRIDTSEAHRKRIVLAACACARLSLKHIREGELRPLKAIETAEAWTRGDATIEDVRVARNAAYAAYAAYAAAAAADAAYAAAAAADAAYAAARKQMQADCAKAVRTVFPIVPEATHA